MAVINPVKPSVDTLLASEELPVDERMVKTIQQQYQTNHQEEFLRLRVQVEALLTELQATVSGGSQNSELAL